MIYTYYYHIYTYIYKLFSFFHFVECVLCLEEILPIIILPEQDRLLKKSELISKSRN